MEILGSYSGICNYKAAPAVVTPIFQNAGKTIDGERMYATYKLSVEDLKKGNLSTPGENNYISIAALEATLVNGEKKVKKSLQLLLTMQPSCR